MRIGMPIAIAIVMMGLGGCGAAEPPAPPVEDAPILLKAGQWTLTRTLTGYESATVTPAERAAKVGTKSEEQVCIAVDTAGLPNADALAGKDGNACAYKEPSVRKGRFIATLACKTPAGKSEFMMQGKYTPETLAVITTMTKWQGANMELQTNYDLSGARTGDCPAT